MSGFYEGAGCPVQNYCIVSAEQGPPCGTAPDHLRPSLLAEEVCESALVEQLRRAEGGTLGRRSSIASVQELQVASAKLELGLSPASGGARSAAYLDEAEAALATLPERPDLAMHDVLQARLLHGFMPAFRARSLGRSLGTAGRQPVRASLAETYDLLHATSVHEDQPLEHRTLEHPLCYVNEKERRQLLGKTTFGLLTLEAGYDVFPSSFRERHALGPKQKKQMHDLYIVQPSGKLPLKLVGTQKTKQSRAGVLSVALPDIAAGALDALDGSVGSVGHDLDGSDVMETAGIQLAASARDRAAAQSGRRMVAEMAALFRQEIDSRP